MQKNPKGEVDNQICATKDGKMILLAWISTGSMIAGAERIRPSRSESILTSSLGRPSKTTERIFSVNGKGGYPSIPLSCFRPNDFR